MKKLVTLLLCLALALGMVGMVGCDSTFKGNYKEVSADSAEVQRFSEETENSSQNENFDITKGAEIEFKVKGSENGMKLDLTANVKIALVGEEDTALQGEGAVKGSVDGKIGNTDSNTKIDVKFYYVDNYVYLNGTVNSVAGDNKQNTELKNKIPMRLEDGLGNMLGMATGIPAAEDLEDVAGLVQGNIFVQLVAMAEGNESVKIFLDAEARKVKIVVSDFALEGANLNGEIYLVYDEQYNLTAFKLDGKAKTADNEEISVLFSFKGYAGKVSVPSENDRKEYQDFSASAFFGF